MHETAMQDVRIFALVLSPVLLATYNCNRQGEALHTSLNGNVHTRMDCIECLPAAGRYEEWIAVYGGDRLLRLLRL